MKIIHIIYDSIENPWLNGGGAHRTHELYRRLVGKHEVHVFCGNFPHSKEVIDGVHYHHLGFSSSYLLSRLSFLFCLHIKFFTSQADVYIEDIGFPFPLFLSLFKKNVIASIQFIPNDAYAEKRGLLGKFVSLFHSKGLRFYKKFITVSKYAASYIKQFNVNADIRVIPNGTIIPLKTSRTTTEKYILYLGRIDVVGKGLDVLLEAMKYVQEKNSSVILKIAGSGEKSEIERLKELITFYNLNDIVVYVGHVGGEEKDLLFRNCLFLVFPSKSETFGLSALESFTYEKPVIASSVGGLKEIVEESGGGYVVDPHNVRDFSEKILMLYDDTHLVSSLGVKGRIFAQHYQWDEIVNDYERTIQELR